MSCPDAIVDGCKGSADGTAKRHLLRQVQMSCELGRNHFVMARAVVVGTARSHLGTHRRARAQLSIITERNRNCRVARLKTPGLERDVLDAGAKSNVAAGAERQLPANVTACPIFPAGHSEEVASGKN